MYTDENYYVLQLCSRGSVGDLTRNMVAQLRHLPEDLISYIFFSVTKVRRGTVFKQNMKSLNYLFYYPQIKLKDLVKEVSDPGEIE